MFTFGTTETPEPKRRLHVVVHTPIPCEAFGDTGVILNSTDTHCEVLFDRGGSPEVLPIDRVVLL